MQLARYVKFREEQFGGVLFETQTEKVYTLNPTAAAVIREIRSGTHVSQIPARVRTQFQTRPAPSNRMFSRWFRSFGKRV